MFSGGILVMVAGILRCVLILTSGVNGPEQAGEWSIRESFIAVVVGNLPMLYTLIQRIQQTGPGSWNKSSNKKNYPLASYRSGGSSKVGRKAKKFHHPLSVPNDTAMDSDERIVMEPKQELPRPPSAATCSRGHLDPSHNGGNRTPNNGIRIQTDLHIESSDGDGQAVDRGNGYHHFLGSKV
ncbi:MAG: hypothetical protein LQ338_002261 [Usnochroma carphineum]|nr:MAG: hypothetical protein LQ338_002261 [Usnochroma carphineum]